MGLQTVTWCLHLDTTYQEMSGNIYRSILITVRFPAIPSHRLPVPGPCTPGESRPSPGRVSRQTPTNSLAQLNNDLHLDDRACSTNRLFNWKNQRPNRQSQPLLFSSSRLLVSSSSAPPQPRPRARGLSTSISR